MTETNANNECSKHKGKGNCSFVMGNRWDTIHKPSAFIQYFALIKNKNVDERSVHSIDWNYGHTPFSSDFSFSFCLRIMKSDIYVSNSFGLTWIDQLPAFVSTQDSVRIFFWTILQINIFFVFIFRNRVENNLHYAIAYIRITSRITPERRIMLTIHIDNIGKYLFFTFSVRTKCYCFHIRANRKFCYKSCTARSYRHQFFVSVRHFYDKLI